MSYSPDENQSIKRTISTLFSCAPPFPGKNTSLSRSLSVVVATNERDYRHPPPSPQRPELLSRALIIFSLGGYKKRGEEFDRRGVCSRGFCFSFGRLLRFVGSTLFVDLCGLIFSLSRARVEISHRERDQEKEEEEEFETDRPEKT